MSDTESDEKGGNGFPDYEQAIEDKKTCETCAYGNGPFLVPLAGVSPVAGGVQMAPMRICGCFTSERYGLLAADQSSCSGAWKEKAAQNIQIAHSFKAPPPVKLGGR